MTLYRSRAGDVLGQLSLDQEDRLRVVEIERGRWLDPCYGAKCSRCGAWLTKWDFSEQDATACALDALERSHTCRPR